MIFQSQDILNPDADFALLENKDWFLTLLSVTDILGEVQDSFHFSSPFDTATEAFGKSFEHPGKI